MKGNNRNGKLPLAFPMPYHSPYGVIRYHFRNIIDKDQSPDPIRPSDLHVHVLRNAIRRQSCDGRRPLLVFVLTSTAMETTWIVHGFSINDQRIFDGF